MTAKGEHMTVTDELTGMDEAFEEYIAKYSNWGRWGADDQIGTANYITRQKVRAAARLVRTGQVISLAMEFNQDGPQTGANGRFNCLRYSVATGTDHVTGGQLWGDGPMPRQMGYADDSVVLHLQSATHWDTLCHIFHGGRTYNGYPAGEITSRGAPRLGAEHLSSSLVGRGVLLDLPRAKGVDWLEDGYPITIDDLEAAAEAQRVVVREGDILLLRTGQMARCLQQGWGTYSGGDAPGLSFFTVPWLAEKRIAAVASDTWGVEVRPNELPDSFQPLHIPAIVYMGLLIGEMFQLEQLAAACADDGVYEMFISAPPLPFTGTAGAPPGPVAIR
jgi:kynurenine formamidase